MALKELLPATTCGLILFENNTINCMQMVEPFGLIVAIEFINQGVNSTVRVETSGGNVILAPGTNLQGSSWKVCQPDYTYDRTEYKIYFTVDDEGSDHVHKCVVNYLKISRDCMSKTSKC